MKSILKLMIVAIVAVLASCSDADRAIYDGNSSNQTLLKFGHVAYDFAIPKDSDTALDIEVQASTKTSSDRTYNVEVIQDPERTTADPSTYTVPSTVTIPAGKYIGHLMVEGVDNGVESTPVEIITLKLTDPNSNDNTVLESDVTVLSQFEVCPVPPDFLVGTYNLVNLVENIGPANGTHNFSPGEINITVGDEQTDRVFSSDIIGFGVVKVTLQLKCGLFDLKKVDPNVSCNGNDLYIYMSAADGNKSTYDADDELDSYTINYTEDPNGSCGGPFQSSFKLTKVN